MRISRFAFAAFAMMIAVYIFSCNKTPVTTNGGKTTGDTTASTKDSIVYTDVNPDSTLFNNTDSFYLDLNNDGIVDFIFEKLNDIISCGGDDLMGYSYKYFTSVSLTPVTQNNAIASDTLHFALALDSTSKIGSDSLWGTSSQALLRAYRGQGRCSSGYSGITGHWINTVDKFLGLKLVKGNNTYYGWARLTSTSYFENNSPLSFKYNKLVLKDYAYNATPNRPILAGQKH